MNRSVMESWQLIALLITAVACGGIVGPEQTAEERSIDLTTKTYTVSGTVSGLSGMVVLRDNGTDNLVRTLDGPFTFSTALSNGSMYEVTVFAQPSGQTCVVANGTGTIVRANITNIAVSCTTNAVFTVGGTITGLSGTVVLQDNGGDDLSASADGPFTFATALADGSSYAVTVLGNPVDQMCTVTNGSGAIAGASVTDVGVSCGPLVFYSQDQGYCEVDSITGQLTGNCVDVGTCFAGPSAWCGGAPFGTVEQAYCGNLVDNTWCLFE